MSIDVGFSAAPVFNEQDRLLMNTYISAVENMFTIRSNFLQQLLDPRRDIDQECGYPQSMTGSGFGSINPDLYRVLYEREGIACRVVQLYPNACWQKSPMVFETEDPEVVTPFEEAWDGISKQLRGEICHYQDEEGSPVWNYLHRADTLSGIGTFGVILLGVDDGKNLDQPLDGVASYDPTGNMEMTHEWLWNNVKVTKKVPIVNAEGQVVGDREQVIGVKRTFNGKRTSVFPTSPRAEPNPSCNRLEVDYYPIYENGTDGLPRQIGFKEHEYKGQVNNEASPTNNGVRVVNELPALFKETNLEADSQRPGFEASSGPKNAQGTGLLSSGQVGTDAQYVGIQLSPSEYPSDKASTEQRRLLFVRCYDESLVQIVQYEANVRNPRFGQPVMYRITLNDPREQHSGIGLPMATVRVHWSRIIHISDNNGSSEVFGVPRMRPNLNRVLDLRKIYASSAEGYWQQAFAKLVLSTHPQLGGDVKVNVPQLQNMLENVRNGLQREMLLMGMAASTVAPSVTDPTPHITVHIEAICIQIGCPVRVFKGSERGELASSQDDDEWLDHVRFRQHNQCTPKIIVPFVDRLIACGVLPAPGQGGKTPTGKKVPAGKGWSKGGKDSDSNGNTLSSSDKGGDGGIGKDGRQSSGLASPANGDSRGTKPDPVIGNRRMTWNRVLEKWELADNAFPPSTSPNASQPKPTPSPPSNGAPKPPGGPPQAGGAPAPKPPKVTVPDTGKPQGYSVEWPDLDSLGDKDKAAIALQVVQAIQAYIAGGCEAVLPVFDFFVQVLGWDEELVTPILLKVQSQAEPTMSIPPPGELGHPATAEPEPKPPVIMGPGGNPDDPAQDDDSGEGGEDEDTLEDAQPHTQPATNLLGLTREEMIFNWCNKYGGTTCKDGRGFTPKEKPAKAVKEPKAKAEPKGKPAVKGKAPAPKAKSSPVKQSAVKSPEKKDQTKDTPVKSQEPKKGVEGPPKVSYTNGKVLRSAKLALAHPALQAMGSSLNVRDPHIPEVAQHLQDLTKVPTKLAEAVRDAGQKVFVGDGGITKLDDNGHLSGRISGQNNIDYEKMPACYSQTRKVVSIGTGKSASSSMALHEYGHSVDNSLGLSKDPELKEIHKSQYDKLKPYYQNGGPGGSKGMSEMVAEGFASYHIDRDKCRKDYGDAFVGWLSRKLKDFQ